MLGPGGPRRGEGEPSGFLSSSVTKYGGGRQQGGYIARVVLWAKTELLFPGRSLDLDWFTGNLGKSCGTMESCGFLDRRPPSFPCLPPCHPPLSCPPARSRAEGVALTHRVFLVAATALPWLGRGSRPVTSLVNVERPLGENERRQRNRVLWPEVGVRPLPVNFLVQLRLLGKTCNESFHFVGS